MGPGRAKEKAPRPARARDSRGTTLLHPPLAGTGLGTPPAPGLTPRCLHQRGLRVHGRTRPGLLGWRRWAGGSGAMFAGRTGGLAPSPPRWGVRTGYSSPSWPLLLLWFRTGGLRVSGEDPLFPGSSRLRRILAWPCPRCQVCRHRGRSRARSRPGPPLLVLGLGPLQRRRRGWRTSPPSESPRLRLQPGSWPDRPGQPAGVSPSPRRHHRLPIPQAGAPTALRRALADPQPDRGSGTRPGVPRPGRVFDGSAGGSAPGRVHRRPAWRSPATPVAPFRKLFPTQPFRWRCRDVS